MSDKKASLDDLTELAKLLQKERSETERKEIEKILQEAIPTKTKIRLIEKLDTKEAPPAKKKAPEPSAAEKDEDLRMTSLDRVLETWAEDQPGPTQSTLQKNRDFLVKPVARGGFLGFLFFELSPMLKFGRETGTIRQSNLWNLRLSSEVWAALHKSWKKAGIEMVKLLKPVMDIGWLHLTRHQYNCVAALLELSESLGQFNIPVEKNMDALVATVLKRVERAYFTLINDPETISTLTEALNIMIHRDPSLKFSMERLFSLQRKLLNGAPGLPCLEDIVRAATMLKSRRYIGLDQIFARSKLTLISTGFFEGPPEIQEKIKSWLRDNEKRLANLLRHWEETLSLNAYLPDQALENQQPLEAFYNFAVTDGKSSFHKDFDNPPIFLNSTITKFNAVFHQILVGQATLISRAKVRIFESQVFSHELDKMEVLAGRISKMVYQTTGFSKKHYLELKSRVKNPTGYEASILQAIDEGLTLFVVIAKKLMEVLRSCASVSSAQAGDPLDGRVLQGKSLPIPYFHEFLSEEGPMNGKTLQYALEQAITISLLVAIALQEPTITSTLRSQEQWEKDIHAILGAVERIASPHVARYFRQKYQP